MYYHDDNTWARGRKGFYDVRGNRVTKTHDSDGDATAEEIIEYTYNDWNQMTEMLVDKDADGDSDGDEKYTYTYNDNGAVDLEQKSEYATSWSAASDYVDYTYNVLGQLTDFDNKVAGATDCSYKYDVLGRRIEATIGSTTEHYFYDGNDVIADYDDSATPALKKRYLTPGLDENMIVWDVANSKTGYFFHDGLGSVRNLLDSSGAKIVTYDYTAFGETTTTNGAGHYEGFTNRYQYTGREKDASDHYYYRARYYRPSQGRFGSTDPVTSSNLYVYVRNNPCVYQDPFGLHLEWDESIMGARPDRDIDETDVASALLDRVWKLLGVSYNRQQIGLLSKYNVNSGALELMHDYTLLKARSHAEREPIILYGGTSGLNNKEFTSKLVHEAIGAIVFKETGHIESSAWKKGQALHPFALIAEVMYFSKIGFDFNEERDKKWLNSLDDIGANCRSSRLELSGPVTEVTSAIDWAIKCLSGELHQKGNQTSKLFSSKITLHDLAWDEDIYTYTVQGVCRCKSINNKPVYYIEPNFNKSSSKPKPPVGGVKNPMLNPFLPDVPHYKKGDLPA